MGVGGYSITQQEHPALPTQRQPQETGASLGPVRLLVVGHHCEAALARRASTGGVRRGGRLEVFEVFEVFEVVRLVGEIEERVPDILVRHRARLVERVRDLAGDVSIAEADLAREVALLADRLDVAEEIARLRSHLDQLDALLAKGGAIGRKLDFLAQEFFREANTIGSKCSDSVVAHLVVDLKTQVERLREQVQNVE